MLSSLLVAQLLSQSPWPMTDCGLEPPEQLQSVLPVPRKAFELPPQEHEVPIVRREVPGPQLIGSLPTARFTSTGSLSGKTIYLSAGHGFTWVSGLGWRTQRGQMNAMNQDLEVVEDLISTETIHQLVLPMLMNAGARVITVRESDTNLNLVTVDNSQPGYQENGPGFADSSVMGWAPPPNPITDATNPFTLGNNRLLDVGPGITSSASFTATLPQDGEYNVYVAYTAFSARATDAHYVVRHAGGQSHFRVNQQRGGGTWQLLGRFYFKAGQPAVVEVLGDSAEMRSPLNVSLDAVRFGGGMGLIDRGMGVSGRPRFEECSRYHSQYSGAPTSVYDYSSTDGNDDVGNRSRFSAWQHETGEDAIFVSWHTNAFDGSAVGTDLYVYGPNPPDGTYQFTGVPGSDTLATAILNEIINDVRSPDGWNIPTWRKRGPHSGYFGEINPTHNNEMPSVLMEIAFHDNVSDAAQLKEPGFRYHVARAVVQGIIKWFAAKDGTMLLLPPEAPTHASATIEGGEVRLKWHAPAMDSSNVRGAQPSSYRVYSSADGLAWDDGVAVPSGTTWAAPISTVRYFRITSVNSGGESFPSEIVGARPGMGPRALVVNGYDRLDATLMKKEDLTRWGLGQVQRQFYDRMNDGAGIVRHGDALDFAQLPFDSATTAAVQAGEASTGGAALIDFVGGRGHPMEAGLSPSERTTLAATKRFVSGATVARASDASFVGTSLFAAKASTSTALSIATSGVFEGVGTLTLGDGSPGTYWNGSNDVITAMGGAAAGEYAAGQVAAVSGSDGVFLGFPWENISSRPQRLEVMARSLKHLGLIGAVPPIPDGGEMMSPDAGPADPVVLDQLPTDYPAVPKGCGCTGVSEAGFALALLVIRRIASRRHGYQNRN